MLHDTDTTIVGEVTDVFAHRFVIESATKRILADLGPEGAKQISLRKGDQVEISGEMKPSELKVARIVRAGEDPVVISGAKHHHRSRHAPNSEVDETLALAILNARNLVAASSVRRKPKHFEILGRDTNGDLFELHIELDGTLRKIKPARADESKWTTNRVL